MKILLVIICIVALGWVGLFIGMYLAWHLKKTGEKIMSKTGSMDCPKCDVWIAECQCYQPSPNYTDGSIVINEWPHIEAALNANPQLNAKVQAEIQTMINDGRITTCSFESSNEIPF